MLTPLMPVPRPSMSSPSSTTLSVDAALMTIPFVPDTSTPASKWSERIVIDLVIVTAPKPPGSSTLISPAEAVLEIAPAKVLHGAVRLHGLASSPTPETQVRVACAFAEPADTISMNAMPNRLAHTVRKRIDRPPLNGPPHGPGGAVRAQPVSCPVYTTVSTPRD